MENNILGADDVVTRFLRCNELNRASSCRQKLRININISPYFLDWIVLKEVNKASKCTDYSFLIDLTNFHEVSLEIERKSRNQHMETFWNLAAWELVIELLE